MGEHNRLELIPNPFGDRKGLAPPSIAPAHGTQKLEKTSSAEVPAASTCRSPPFDAEPSIELGQKLDRALHFAISRFTFGISPMGLAEAYFDWLMHLSSSPGKQAELWYEAGNNTAKLFQYLASCVCHEQFDTTPCIAPLPNDKRFSGDEWHTFPFNVLHQAFLLNQHWWQTATTGVRGASRHHARVVEFAARQLLDIASPSNFLLTNPEALKKTRLESGENLTQGFLHFIEDWRRSISNAPHAGVEAFKKGVELAATPGEVVYRNHLIELIQYEPSTSQVRPEPVLIIPAWIMKYYILDLSAKNSLVRYLRDNGFTVFMLSWRNPQAEDKNLGFEDYLKLGVMSAIDTVHKIVPEQKIHATGYCLGGTLLSMASAAMARGGDDRLKTISLFAAQTDFTEAGELTLFTSESQIAFLEDMMAEQGYLDAGHMAGAFQMLRSSDLVWSRAVRDYLMGERQPVFDLMAWNADTTRMPYRMHSEYLRKLFLNNDLAEGRFEVGGRPVALSDIRQSIFLVATETDHVSPWRSVYKLSTLADTGVTFLLTSGGHNAGIVSEPGHTGRNYRVSTKKADDQFVDPETWFARTPARPGSWWPEWTNWLVAQSGEPAAPPRLGLPGRQSLGKAPGTYVFQT